MESHEPVTKSQFFKFIQSGTHIFLIFKNSFLCHHEACNLPNSWSGCANVLFNLYTCIKYSDCFSFPGDNSRDTGKSHHAFSTSKDTESNLCDKVVIEMTKNIVIKKEDLNPSSRKSNEYRTTVGDTSRQQRTTPCPAIVTTPLAASTPTVLPPRKTCSSSATKFMENESKLQGPRDLPIGDLTGQQDNYSVIPEGITLIKLFKIEMSIPKSLFFYPQTLSPKL